MEKFEIEFERFLAGHIDSATGQRREMLKADLKGTNLLLEVVIWPALKSFEGVKLEYEMLTSTGVKMYVDAFYEPLMIAFECEGYVSHAEKITRDRFDFEKTRIRSVGKSRKMFMPYSKDQLDKQPEMQTRLFRSIGPIYEHLGE
jgi:hypothetical protein